MAYVWIICVEERHSPNSSKCMLLNNSFKFFVNIFKKAINTALSAAHTK